MSNPLWTGDIFAGKYRVETILGKGGMGMVLGARHIALDEPVAIKVLLPDMMEIPGMVERFLREARAASKIKSEHVVRVTDVDVLAPSGVPYMVMERLEGCDLAQLRKRHGRLPVAQAAGWVLEASEAVAEAHALGIVHRDLKPANLFLARRRDGSSCVKVLDFGISKMIAAPGAADPQVTTTGTLLGSPSYMAPEQMISTRDVDARADLWSLGVILYELLTGTLPFRGATMAALCVEVLKGSPPAPPSLLQPDVPSPLDAIVARCLERDRERRVATVAELAAMLVPFADGAPASTSRWAEPLSSRDAGRGAALGLALVEPPPSSKAAPALSLSDTMGGSVTPPRVRVPRRAQAVAAGVAAGLAVAGCIFALSRARQPTTAETSAPAPAHAALADTPATAATPADPPRPVGAADTTSETPRAAPADVTAAPRSPVATAKAAAPLSTITATAKDPPVKPRAPSTPAATTTSSSPPADPFRGVRK